jgi:transcriptional regulator with XRE-family HTH domain
MQELIYHNLRDDAFFPLWQNEGMESDDKNGGPNHLAEWREYRKMTQAKLAEAVGTNANMISMLENAERGLSAKWLRRLAPILDTTPGMLLDHSPFDLSTDVIDLWSRADLRERRQLSEIARTIVRDGTNS